MENKLHKNAIKSWVIARSIGTVIFLAISFIAFYLTKYWFNIEWVSRNQKYILIAVTIVCVLCVLDIVVYPHIEYKTWKYTLTTEKLDFTEGLFIKKRTIVPIIKIEHIEIKIGPINSKLGLADIEIFTAGGSHTIPNLEIKTANEIGEYLNAKIKEKVEALNGKRKDL